MLKFKNMPIKEICEKYDLDSQTVHRWVKEFKAKGMSGWEEQDKKLKMQKRIKELEMENIKNDDRYQKICEKLGLDLLEDPVPVIVGEYDGTTIFDRLTLEDFEYLKEININDKINYLEIENY